MIAAIAIYAFSALAVWIWVWRTADHDLCGMGCLLGLLWPLFIALAVLD